MEKRSHIAQSFKAATPIMLGYVAIGLPCGILASSIGLNWLQVLIMSILFYSGAGQFMLPNMYLAGSPLASIIASISFVNTRQMLYSAAFAKHCKSESKALSFLFAATVTDESFGVNTAKFEYGGWSIDRATFVNLFSQSSWTLANVAGVLVGDAVNIPLPVAAFAMTSIFICLMATQKIDIGNAVAMVAAMAGVFLCKWAGFSGPAILVGAVIGVVSAMLVSSLRKGGKGARASEGRRSCGAADPAEIPSCATDAQAPSGTAAEDVSCDSAPEGDSRAKRGGGRG